MMSPETSTARTGERSSSERTPTDGEQHGRERQQAPGAAGVEAAQRDAAGAVDLAEQEPGDQEAGDDEEDVDADVAAGEEGDARVAEQDGDDRDGSQPLDVGAEAVSGCRSYS